MTRFTTSDVRKNFSEALNRVAFGGERLVLRRRGKDLVAMIPIEDLALLEEIEDREDVTAAKKALAKRGRSIPWEEYKKRRGA